MVTPFNNPPRSATPPRLGYQTGPIGGGVHPGSDHFEAAPVHIPPDIEVSEELGNLYVLKTPVVSSSVPPFLILSYYINHA